MNEEMKLNIVEDYRELLQKLYGTDETVTYESKVKEFETKLDEFISKSGDADFDIQVNVKYRLGQMKKGNGVTKYLKGKTLGKSLDSQFEIEEDATAIDVVVRPVYLNNKSKYASRNKNEILFEQRIVIGNGVESRDSEKIRKKYGIREDDMFLSLRDMKKSKLLKFKPVTYNVEQ